MANALYFPKYFVEGQVDEVLLCVEYDESIDETIIYPKDADTFNIRLPSYTKYLDALKTAGFDVVTAHNYSISVAGNPAKL